MKDVDTNLATYLATVKNITSCDLYRLVLANGNEYRYCDTDTDITYNGLVYPHNALILSRKQTKINSTITVDSMSVTVYTGKSDKLEAKSFMKALHDGSLDRAEMYISRCYFRDLTVVGVIDLFSGNVEIKSAGGLKVELTVKAKTQGLNMQFPLRKYYPQGTYTVNSGSKVISATTEENTCLIAPFVPRKEILL